MRFRSASCAATCGGRPGRKRARRSRPVRPPSCPRAGRDGRIFARLAGLGGTLLQLRQLLASGDHVGILIGILQTQGRDPVFQGRDLGLLRRRAAAIACQGGVVDRACILDIGCGIGFLFGVGRGWRRCRSAAWNSAIFCCGFRQFALIDRDLRIEEDIGLAEILLRAILVGRHELVQQQLHHAVGAHRIGGLVVEFGETVAIVGNDLDLVPQRQRSTPGGRPGSAWKGRGSAVPPPCPGSGRSAASSGPHRCCHSRRPPATHSARRQPAASAW